MTTEMRAIPVELMLAGNYRRRRARRGMIRRRLGSDGLGLVGMMSRALASVVFVLMLGIASLHRFTVPRCSSIDEADTLAKPCNIFGDRA